MTLSPTVGSRLGSLAAWKKKRELGHHQVPADEEFRNSVEALKREFTAKFLPRAAESIEQSLNESIDALLRKQSEAILGGADDVQAKSSVGELMAIEHALLGEKGAVEGQVMTGREVLELLQNPGPRLDIYSPRLDFSLAPILQCLPPDTVLRVVTTANANDRKEVSTQVERAFGNWQGKRKVFCVSLADGSALPDRQTLLVTTDTALITDGVLAHIGQGELQFRMHPNGRIAGQRAFAELWDGWSSAHGQLDRFSVY